MPDIEELEAMRARTAQRAVLNSQIASAQKVLASLTTSKEKLEKKIKKYSTALTNMNSHKADFNSGKSGLTSITIDSGSWKGEKATKAKTSFETMKTNVESISKKIDNAEDTIEQEKRQAETELENMTTQIAVQNSTIVNLTAQLGSIR